jgi:hypothetical protein
VLCNNDGDIVFLDDDDEWVPGALDAMRRFATEHPGRVGIFMIRYKFHRDQWHRKSLSEYCTPMSVVPNVPGRVGTFGPASTSDPLLRVPPSSKARAIESEAALDNGFASTLQREASPPGTASSWQVPTIGEMALAL